MVVISSGEKKFKIYIFTEVDRETRKGNLYN